MQRSRCPRSIKTLRPGEVPGRKKTMNAIKKVCAEVWFTAATLLAIALIFGMTAAMWIFTPKAVLKEMDEINRMEE